MHKPLLDKLGKYVFAQNLIGFMRMYTSVQTICVHMAWTGGWACAQGCLGPVPGPLQALCILREKRNVMGAFNFNNSNMYGTHDISPLSRRVKRVTVQLRVQRVNQ